MKKRTFKYPSDGIFYLYSLVISSLVVYWFKYTAIANQLEFGKKKFAFIFVISFVLLSLIFYIYKRFLKEKNIIYRYRYLIVIIVLITFVVLKINGSSLGIWKEFLNTGQYDQVLLGKSRLLRSDEWNVTIPYIASQYYNGFSYFSNIIRGTLTDVFIVNNLPVMSLVSLYRPANIGFLFLGFDRGLSFFWTFRTILLIMSLFELGMVITKGKKINSMFFSLMITFSPLVQWWFAAVGLVEMISMGALFVVFFDKYLKTNNTKFKLLYSVLMGWFANVYILTFYPAWQVPLGFIYMALVTYLIVVNYKEYKFSKIDFLALIILFLQIVLGCGYVLLQSQETIKTIFNTVYPGKRTSFGGGDSSGWLFDYVQSLHSPTLDIINERAMDVVYDFFPIPIILGFYTAIKKKDLLQYFFLAINIVFLLYIVFPFPPLVAKLSLLSFSTGARVLGIYGILNIFILTRSISQFNRKKIAINKALILSLITTILLCYISWKNSSDYLMQTASSYNETLSKAVLIITSVVIFVFIFSLCIKNKKIGGLALIVIFFLSGVLVNPVRVGSDTLFKSKLVQEIKKNADGNWIVDSSLSAIPFNNLPIVAGVSTINSTNSYPNLKLWKLLDTTKENENIFNRFAHITIELKTDDQIEFSLFAPDAMLVKLPISDLKKMNVNKILSQNDLSQMSTDKVEFRLLTEIDNFKIFEVIYHD